MNIENWPIMCAAGTWKRVVNWSNKSSRNMVARLKTKLNSFIFMMGHILNDSGSLDSL